MALKFRHRVKESRVIIPRPRRSDPDRSRVVESVGRGWSFDTEDFDDYLMDDIPPLPDDFNLREEGEELTQLEFEQIRGENAAYRRDPLLFVKKELGIPPYWRHKKVITLGDEPPEGYKYKPYKTLPLWSKQREILEAMVEHRRVAVKSGHGVGKTYIAAIVTIYLTYVWRALGVTTAPTWRQVKYLLWHEIANIYNSANQYRQRANVPSLGGRLLQTSLHLGDKWYVVGFSTDKKDYNIPGFHEETVFAIIDEACGVDPLVFDLLETILNSENAFILYIGNPTDPNTEFKKCFDIGSDFHQLSISCFDSPNVKYGRTIYPKMVRYDWPERMEKKWGAKSALYKSRVLAEFPETSTDSLIPLSSIQAALDRTLPEDTIVAIGGDIARLGGDRIILGKRHKSGAHRIVHNIDRARITETTGRLVQMAEGAKKRVFNKYGNVEHIYEPVINIDDIGVGGGVTDLLIEQGYRVNGINVAESAKGLFLDKEERIRFANKRAYYYWKLRQIFIDGKIDIDDEELAEELGHIRTKTKSNGSIAIIEKNKIKEKLGRSPDKAEECMLAFAEDDVIGGTKATAY